MQVVEDSGGEGGTGEDRLPRGAQPVQRFGEGIGGDADEEAVEVRGPVAEHEIGSDDAAFRTDVAVRGFWSYYAELIEGGVEVYGHERMMHAKAWLADDLFTIGSTNLSRGSQRHFYECSSWQHDGAIYLVLAEPRLLVSEAGLEDRADKCRHPDTVWKNIELSGR